MMVSRTPQVLTANAVSKSYFRRDTYAFRSTRFDAVKSVLLTLQPGALVGVIGESGSGKSTLARILAGLEKPDSGEVRFGNVDVHSLRNDELRAIRPRIQLLLQDSATSLNPRYSTEWLIEEPMRIRRIGTPHELQTRAREALQEVGVDPALRDRTALQLSGGQRQRVALARALVLQPEILILDESFSALDLLTQRNMRKLILELHARHGFTCLFISHDLRLVSEMAEQVLVMHQGEIVERGATLDIFARPAHPHTVSLVAAVQRVRSACAAAMSL